MLMIRSVFSCHDKTSFTSRPLLSFLLLGLYLTPLPAFSQENGNQANQPEKTTTIYKVVNPDGSVSFSDQPAARAETLQVAPVPTVPALNPEQISKARQGVQTQTQSQTDISIYESFSVLSPADQSAFNSGSGDVSVVLELYPGLLNGHEIELRMDQKLINRGSQMQVTIPAVDRGTHTLEARVLSSSGKVLKETRSIFTLHRPTIRR
jgi:hypothetical protein